MRYQYIVDEDDRVVAQFAGKKRDPKEGHESVHVGSVEDLPGVDEWDTDYEDF